MDQAHAAGAADRLDADSYANFVTFQRADFFPEICRFFPRAEANFIELLRKFLLHEIQKLLRLGRAGGVLDSSVNVFCVFPKDDHVYFLRMLERRGDPFEVLHRPQAHKKIEKLPQCHVKRANAAADRSGQRTFDADQIFAECFHGIIWQPVIEFVFRRLTGKNLKPGDLLLPPNAFSTAASNTCSLAAQMSGPVPSPRMKGMIGRSGTFNRSVRVIFSPAGGAMSL